jgi:hypothetical protein
MKSVTYEGVCSCMHNILLVTIKCFLFQGEYFLVCSLESQLEKSRDENLIIYLTAVLKEEINFNDVYKGEIMTYV